MLRRLAYRALPDGTQVLTVAAPARVAASWRKMLARSTALPDCDPDGTIETLAAEFPNGYQVDLKLCNGDTGPWLDAVLFDQQGRELCCLAPDHVALTGEYRFAVRQPGWTQQFRLRVKRGPSPRGGVTGWSGNPATHRRR